jgi:hypothetical protein
MQQVGSEILWVSLVIRSALLNFSGQDANRLPPSVDGVKS